jgi:superfamily II DNA or RNA helicase
MILERRTQIVVCVDMLGEGFDLPELKIAAFHDVKKSLAVTLQLAGRFTRAKPNLGDPTFIANIGDPKVSDELRILYAQDAN